MTAPTTPSTPLIAEDLLLLLFDPRSGTIAGEGTLFYALAGALLTELAFNENVEIDERPGLTGPRVSVVADNPPVDDLLREPWDLVAQKPRGAQTFLAEIGPRLRGPILDRLVERGHIRREQRKTFGFIPTTVLSAGETSRRADLLDTVRPVLTDGAEPDPRSGLLAALLSASGSLPTLYWDIPWSGAVHTRGKELEQGDWGAAAASQAVLRTTMAIATSSAAIAISATQST